MEEDLFHHVIVIAIRAHYQRRIVHHAEVELILTHLISVVLASLIAKHAQRELHVPPAIAITLGIIQVVLV